MRVWGRGEPVWWEVIARNKKSVSINLRMLEGQALARRLIGQADILIENFRPGALEAWGLGPEDLRRDHPGLIVVRMSGYGQDGPYADRTGFGGIGEAMGGWRAIVGDPDRAPSRMGVSIGDSLAATYGCMGALAALHHREKTGEGQIVDSALYEAVLQVMESLVPEYAVAGIVRERSGSIPARHRAVQRLSTQRRRRLHDRGQQRRHLRAPVPSDGSAGVGAGCAVPDSTSRGARVRPSWTS